MSNMATTAVAAHQWLRSNIATALGIRVFNRRLNGEEIPDNFAVIGTVNKLEQEWAAFGNGRRDEHYLISGLVRVAAGPDASGTFSDAEIDTLYGNAWQYVNGIAALVSGLTVNGVVGDPRLGGAVLFAQFQAADEEPPEDTTSGKVEVAVTFDIACRAQATK